MQDELISKQEVLEQINCWIGSGEYRYAMSERFLIDRIKTLPPAKQEPKTGHWIMLGTKDEIYCEEAKCSICGILEVNAGYDNYCPNCGARMFEQKEGTNK